MSKAGDGADGASSSAAAAAPIPESDADTLPPTVVRRIVREKIAAATAAAGGDEISVQKDALIAFAESARIFIHYLSATANDVCKEAKRQTIGAEDVLKALEEIEFPEFVHPLRAALQEFRRKNAEKKSVANANPSEKKRKLDDSAARSKDQEDEAGDAGETGNGDAAAEDNAE